MRHSIGPAGEGVEPVALRVTFDEERFWVGFADGRVLGVPYSRFPRLAQGTPAQRRNFRTAEDGRSLHWPELDEDIGVELLMTYTPPQKT
jgi:hypothetical protein